MRTIIAQLSISVLLLVFAAAAVRVAQAIPPRFATFRFGWALTGAAFAVQGANSLLHHVLAAVAFARGSGSWAWDAVLFLNPLLNHSRTFLLTAYCAVLCVALWRVHRGRPVPRLRSAFLFVVGGMLAGAVVGWREDAFSGFTHYSAVALWDIMELLALMAVLLMGVATAGVDRSLWAALSVNACILALSVLLFAALTQVDFAGQWSPRPWHVQTSKALLYLPMIAIAVRQLVRLRAGRPMRAFFDVGSRASVPSLHG